MAIYQRMVLFMDSLCQSTQTGTMCGKGFTLKILNIIVSEMKRDPDIMDFNSILKDLN